MQQNVPAHKLFEYFEQDALSDRYQRLFGLAADEKLDSEGSGTVFDPFYKQHVEGKLFFSQRYLCFLSDELDRCTLVLPFRDVVNAEAMVSGTESRKSKATEASGEQDCNPIQPHMPAHTRTPTNTHTSTHPHAHTRTPAHPHPRTRTHPHAHPHTHTCTCTCTPPPTHPHTHTPTHARTPYATAGLSTSCRR